MRFISPTDEEIAFELIIACGGVPEAMDFFEAWVGKVQDAHSAQDTPSE
jgi:hypothetical protein